MAIMWHKARKPVRTALSPNEGLKVVKNGNSRSPRMVRTALSPNEGLKVTIDVSNDDAPVGQNSAKPE